MGSRMKEDEKNEKIIRGLMKLPPNRRCINCNGLSGVYTPREISIHGKIYFTRSGFSPTWRSICMCGQGDRDDTYENRRPASYHSDSRSPPYEEKYEEHRHGERRALGAQKLESDRGSFDDKTSRFGYGERKSPGGYGSDRGRNDRGYYNNHDNYKRSSGRFEMARNRYEDRFANERLDRRFEDRSFSDARDIQRWDGRSPNYQRDFDIASPPVRPVRDILGDDVPTLRVGDFPRANGHRDTDGSVRSHRTASSSSIGSFDSSSLSLKGVNIESLIDFSSEPECPAAPVQQDPFAVSLFSQSSTGASVTVEQDSFAVSLQPSKGAAATTQQDPFGVSSLRQLPSGPAATAQQDPFAVSSFLPPSTGPASDNAGWATFDFAHHVSQAPAPATVVPTLEPSPGIVDSFGKVNNAEQWPPVQQINGSRPVAPGVENLVPISLPVQPSTGIPSSQQDYFKPAYPEPVLPSIDFNWGSQHGHAGSGSQFASSGMYLLGPKPSYVQHLKSTNPFDLPDDSPAAPTNVFPSMGSLQAALPNSISTASPLLVGPNSLQIPLQAPLSYTPTPAPGMYMGQQPLNTLHPIMQSGETASASSFSTGSFPGDNIFGSLGGQQLRSQRSLSSFGGNPFG